MFNMRRREVITLVGGTAVAWTLAARAQTKRMRRIGVLTFRKNSLMTYVAPTFYLERARMASERRLPVERNRKSRRQKQAMLLGGRPTWIWISGLPKS